VIRPADHDPVLSGFMIGLTADRRADEQASLFERRGATVLHGPSIRTLALGSDGPLRDATDAVLARPPAFVVANTGLGIRSWFSAAEGWGLGDALVEVLAGARIIARGPKAAGAVHAHGLDVDERVGSERLVDAIDLTLDLVRPGDRVALQLDGRGSGDQGERLRAAGAEVIEVPVYEWELPEDLQPAVRLAEAVIAGRVHAVTFTAGPAVRNWLELAEQRGLRGALTSALTDGSVVVGCVGPVCADTAVAEGIGSDHLVVPDRWRLGPLVRCVGDALLARRVIVEVGGARVVVRGTRVEVDDAELVLTDTEAQLLTALAARPGTVHAKSDLLRDVWRDESADPHVVEVTVARIRRQLGPTGLTIGSVYRRGYALQPRG
jgi:uroporphyrinogen-III synthase